LSSNFWVLEESWRLRQPVVFLQRTTIARTSSSEPFLTIH
jgi:hypothetical protein